MKTMRLVLVFGGLMVPLGGCPGGAAEPPSENTLAIFHNGSGPMCLDALAWLETVRAGHPGLAVEEHLTTTPAGRALLEQLMAQYGRSRGVSTSFGYLPVIFFGGQAFSGFNDEVRAELEALIGSTKTTPP